MAAVGGDLLSFDLDPCTHHMHAHTITATIWLSDTDTRPIWQVVADSSVIVSRLAAELRASSSSSSRGGKSSSWCVPVSYL